MSAVEMGATGASDNTFERNVKLPKTQQYRTINLCEDLTSQNSTTKNDGPPRDINKLATQVDMLNLRLTSLEESFRDLSLSVSWVSGKVTNTSDQRKTHTDDLDMFEDREKALAVIDHDLISNQPRSGGIRRQIMNVFVVLKRHNFAKLQCLLMFLAIALVSSFGVVQFFEAQSSMNEEYRPYKLDGITYNFADDNSVYEDPLLYLWFEILIPDQFYIWYEWIYHEACDSSTVETCLERYWEDEFLTMFNSEDGEPRCWRTGGNWQESESDIDTMYSYLRNFSVHVNEYPWGSNYWQKYGVTLKMEFDEHNQDTTGASKCQISLDLQLMLDVMDVNVWVSREEYTSGEIGWTGHFPAMKRIHLNHYQTQLISYDYSYYERTYDGKSQITADMNVGVVLTGRNFDSGLIINMYAPSYVENYVSYYRYSYLDWLADVGGLFTLVIGFFLMLTARVTKFVYRNENFRLNQGILPALSLSYRNAEEIAGLRSITMAGLGITEEKYFSA